MQTQTSTSHPRCPQGPEDQACVFLSPEQTSCRPTSKPPPLPVPLPTDVWMSDSECPNSLHIGARRGLGGPQ